MPLASGRGRIPRIFMNGQAAAYSSRCRIQEAEPYHCRPRFANQEESEIYPVICANDVPLLYFAAASAHCAREAKKAFAPGGGSISPISAVLKGTMRP
jgi:hypothetical protein